MPLQWCIAALVGVGQTQASTPENTVAADQPAVTVLTRDAARPADFPELVRAMWCAEFLADVCLLCP